MWVLFCVFSQKMRRINFFWSFKGSGFGWEPKVYVEEVCVFVFLALRFVGGFALTNGEDLYGKP